MSTEVSLFYNQEACKDVLILIADESSYPDKVEKYEDVIILKQDLYLYDFLDNV